MGIIGLENLYDFEAGEKCLLQCNLWRMREKNTFSVPNKNTKKSKDDKGEDFFYYYLTKIYVEREMKRKSYRIFYVCLGTQSSNKIDFY